MRRTADERTPGGLPGDVESLTAWASAAGLMEVSDVGAAGETTKDTVCLTRPCTVAKVAVFVRSAAQSSWVVNTSPPTLDADGLSDTVTTLAALGVASSSVAQV
jgi:hypothetical protein